MNLIPCVTKRSAMWKFQSIFFFCNFIIDVFIVDVLLKRSCSMEGAAQSLKQSEDMFLQLFLFVSTLSTKFRIHWSQRSIIVSMSDKQTSVVRIFGYISNRCTFDRQYFYYFFLWSFQVIRQGALGFCFTNAPFSIRTRFDNVLTFICSIFVNPCFNLWYP